jgi:Protein of unknown function (DUF1036)
MTTLEFFRYCLPFFLFFSPTASAGVCDALDDGLLSGCPQVVEQKPFHVFNDCEIEIRVAVDVLNTSGDWEVWGWYYLSPNRDAYLRETNGPRITSRNKTWYYYAESTDENSSCKWTGHQSDPNSVTKSISGDRYLFKKVTHKGVSEFKIHLSCQKCEY